MSELDNALTNYENKLTAIENKKNLTQEDVLALLTSRDIVRALLIEKNKKQQLLSKASDLVNLDTRLENLSEAILKTRNLKLTKARKSFHPDPEAWWWFIQPNEPVTWWDKYDKVWNFLAITFLAISIIFMYEIYARFSKGSPDGWAYLVIALNTALVSSLLGIIFTSEGQNIVNKNINKILIFCGLSRNFKQEIRMFVSFIFLSLMVGFHFAMPYFSSMYTESGIELYRVIVNSDRKDRKETTDKKSQIISAKNKFERAIALNPDNGKSHHYLGLIYEKLDNMEQAKIEYLIAINNGYKKSFSNLSRLYIIEKEYDIAAIKLNEINEIINNEEASDDNNNSELLFKVNRNLGWTRFLQNRYEEAKSSLILAEQYTPSNPKELASISCLRAQIVGKVEPNNWTKICQLWQKCAFGGASSLIQEEDNWIGLAQKTLQSPNCK